MKIFASQFTAPERRTLLQKLRLARPSERHGARLTLSFSGADRAELGALDRETLKTWAGPQLGELVAELDRAGHTSTDLGDVIITKNAGGAEEAKSLRLRAQVFGELVRFSLAENRLARAQAPAEVEPSDARTT